MKKILLKDAYPDLAEQFVDKSLLDEIGVADKRKFLWRCDKGHEWEAIVLNRTRKGYGCPYCSGRLAIPGETDLATLMPDLVDELVDITLATQLKVTSHQKVQWKCANGHIYEASPAARTSKKSTCPYCSGHKAYAGETDIATTHPELAKELVDESLVTSIKAGTNRKVEWECSVCGYRWWASPNSRTHMKSGCPKCHGKVLDDSNSLVALRPDLAAEVSDKSLLDELYVTSNKKVLWKCEKGHEWEALVSNRAQFDYGCPICQAASHASKMEREFGEYVAQFADDIEFNNRSLLGGRELDIVIPSKKMAFEFNGVFWHSSARSLASMRTHIDKADALADLGYQLAVVWEDDWQDNRCAVELMIRHLLSRQDDVFDNVTCTLISIETATVFLSENCFNLNNKYDFHVGVYSGEELVAVAACDVVSNNIVIQTFASVCFWQSMMTMLLEYLKTLKLPSQQISLMWDKSWGNGDSLCELGFDVESEIDPLLYIVGEATNWKRILYADAPNDLQEANVCYKTYDSGHICFVLK